MNAQEIDDQLKIWLGELGTHSTRCQELLKTPREKRDGIWLRAYEYHHEREDYCRMMHNMLLDMLDDLHKPSGNPDLDEISGSRH